MVSKKEMNDAKITPSFYDAFNDALKLFTARLGLTSLWFLNSKAYAYFIPFFVFRWFWLTKLS